MTVDFTNMTDEQIKTHILDLLEESKSYGPEFTTQLMGMLYDALGEAKAKQLNTCPFCGREDKDSKVVSHNNSHNVVCAWCGAAGPPESSEKEARLAWNRRAERTS